MYLYFFQRRGWDVSEIDRLAGEQAVLKSVTYIEGAYAFGYLRVEAGVHRLVRPSPFNAQGKRQTSFASVTVVPEFDEVDTKAEIPEDDLDFRRLRPKRQRPRRPKRQQGRRYAVRITHVQTKRYRRHLFCRAQPATEQTPGNEHSQKQD